MAKKKAKPIADLNGKQWNTAEKMVCHMILHENKDDDTIAHEVLNRMFGKMDENAQPQPPPRGYTQDLMDGVRRMVEVRRRQLRSYQ